MLSIVLAQGYLCLTLANLPEPNLNPFRSTPISPSGLFKEGLDAFQCWGSSADQCSKLHYQGLGHLPDYHQPRRWPQQHLWGPVLGRLGRHTHSLNSRQGRDKESAPDERCRKGLGSLVSSLLEGKECWSRAAVLNSSPRAPPLCIFCMLLLSLQMFVLLERKCPAKWTSQDIPPWFQFEANVYIFHSKCIEVCKTWIKIVYIYRGIWCHTRPCVKTLCSANPWMNVPKGSKLQRISLLRE